MQQTQVSYVRYSFFVLFWSISLFLPLIARAEICGYTVFWIVFVILTFVTIPSFDVLHIWFLSNVSEDMVYYLLCIALSAVVLML